MSVITMSYSLDDFHTICANGHNYKLSDDVLSIISKIVLEVGSPSYVKTPVFNKKSYIKSDTNDNIYDIVNTFMRNPVKIEVKTEMLTLEGISQYSVAVENDAQKYATIKHIFSFRDLRISKSLPCASQ